MKKILFIVIAGLCIAVSAIVAMVMMANRVGDSVQSEFFAVVAAADPEVFFAASDPRMRNEIDAPLLRQWMQSLNERLGAYQGLEPTDFHSSTRFEDGNRVVETAGTVRFENGTAYSELTYVNGKLAEFDVTSELMGEIGFKLPMTQPFIEFRRRRFTRRSLIVNSQPPTRFYPKHSSVH